MISDAWLTGLDGRLARQLGFLLEADRLKLVVRGNRIADGSRRENTAEHSWHLALFALVLREWAVGEVDTWRVVRMLVLHDAPGAATQAERERLAADKVFGLLPADQGQELRGLWEKFERAGTPDAKFAKALDRLQPVLLNHAVGGGTWTDYAVTEARVRRLTSRIADGSPALWDSAQAVFADVVARGWLRPTPEAV